MKVNIFKKNDPVDKLTNKVVDSPDELLMWIKDLNPWLQDKRSLTSNMSQKARH
jgi:hypothetical protein